MNIDIPLTDPQRQFCLSKDKNPAIIGGLGCMRGDTRIQTEHGLMRICDITHSTRVLSWNENSQKYQLSLSGGSFPKGRANLYRVVTQRGEFVASEHHRVFSSGGKYLPLGQLRVGDEVKTFFLSLHEKLKGGSQLLSLLDAPRYSKTIEDYHQHCADEARLCGQQLLTAEEYDRFYSPSLNDVHKSCRTSDLPSFLHTDDLAEPSQEHNHHDQPCGQSYRLGCSPLRAELAASVADQKLTSCVEHTLPNRLRFLLSRAKSAFHHKTEQVFSVFRSLSSYCNLYNCIASSTEASTIISIEQLDYNEPYFDMQVLDTNNYICENGFIHHNSGKSRAGTMRLILLLLADKGANGGYYMPSYDLLKLRAMPGVEEDLDLIGLPYTTHISDKIISIHGYGDIIFRSYDRPEKIIAYETAHSIVDELDTLNKEKASLVWRKITERNRQKRGRVNTIGCVTTPDQGFNGFIYQKWVKMRQEGYVLIKAPTTSNPYLPDDYVDQIRANYDPLLAEMYINGEFVSLNDKKVYHFFDRKKHHSDRVIRAGERLYVSIDFNVGGCCSTTWVIDNKKPIAVDEFVSHDTQDFVNNLSRYNGHSITVYPDASGSSRSSNSASTDIDLINNGGYAVDAPEANPFIRDRINAFNALLAHDNIGVNTDKCPELTNALEVQGYTEKGEPEKFNEHPAIDDWVDSSGYFIHRRFAIKRPVAGLAWG
jgi:hypothetical protein